MFGFGFTEFISIVIIVLIFIKPRDLPKIMHKFGKVFGVVRSQLNDLKESFYDAGSELEKPPNDNSGIELEPWGNKQNVEKICLEFNKNILSEEEKEKK